MRAPYVLGSLWNGSDQPPATAPTDAVSKVILHTPQGHVVELDDQQQTITITTIGGQKITLSPQKIELEAGSVEGDVRRRRARSRSQGSTELELKATSISIQATNISVSADASLSLQGSGTASLQGGVVRIN